MEMFEALDDAAVQSAKILERLLEKTRPEARSLGKMSLAGLRKERLILAR